MCEAIVHREAVRSTGHPGLTVREPGTSDCHRHWPSASKPKCSRPCRPVSDVPGRGITSFSLGGCRFGPRWVRCGPCQPPSVRCILIPHCHLEGIGPLAVWLTGYPPYWRWSGAGQRKGRIGLDSVELAGLGLVLCQDW